MITLNGNPIYWKSLTQPTVATSVTEAEIYGMSEGGKSGLRFFYLLQSIMPYLEKFTSAKIPLPMQLIAPAVMHADNQGGIKFAAQPQVQGRLKHIDIRRAAIRSYVEKLLYKLCYVESEKNRANGLTKATTGRALEFFRNQLKIVELP